MTTTFNNAVLSKKPPPQKKATSQVLLVGVRPAVSLPPCPSRLALKFCCGDSPAASRKAALSNRKDLVIMIPIFGSPCNMSPFECRLASIACTKSSHARRYWPVQPRFPG